MDEAAIRDAAHNFANPRSSAYPAAYAAIVPLGVAVVPYLVEEYGGARTWQERAMLVNYATKFARISEEAFQLGLRALSDRSTKVRCCACYVLAYSLRRDAIPALQALLHDPDPARREDAEAAIAAIRQQNHHRFVDRGQFPSVRWQVNPGD